MLTIVNIGSFWHASGTIKARSSENRPLEEAGWFVDGFRESWFASRRPAKAVLWKEGSPALWIATRHLVEV
jgi:hypothetical protein